MVKMPIYKDTSWKTYILSNPDTTTYGTYSGQINYNKTLGLIHVTLFAQGNSTIKTDGHVVIKLPTEIASLIKKSVRVRTGTMTNSDQNNWPMYLEFRPDGYAYAVTVVGNPELYRLNYDVCFPVNMLQ